ncbi:hypothetical protein JD969_04830 [Planctomycetota bacterium]|nr:hypothetical protein JD969_04830 [Planctomycetota bacterium]
MFPMHFSGKARLKGICDNEVLQEEVLLKLQKEIERYDPDESFIKNGEMVVNTRLIKVWGPWKHNLLFGVTHICCWIDQDEEGWVVRYRLSFVKLLLMFLVSWAVFMAFSNIGVLSGGHASYDFVFNLYIPIGMVLVVSVINYAIILLRFVLFMNKFARRVKLKRKTLGK